MGLTVTSTPRVPSRRGTRATPNADDHPTTAQGADVAPGDVDTAGVPPLKFSRATTAPDGPDVTETASAPEPTVKPGILARKITDMYGQIGFMVAAFDPTCGQAVMFNAKEVGIAMERAAKESPEFRKWLEGLFKTNVWLQLAMAHAPIAVAVASHHVPMFRDRAAVMAERMAAAGETAA